MGVPGFITQRTEQDMMEYMRKLEWIIEELEEQLHTLHLKMEEEFPNIIRSPHSS
ncbi:hypothetical protein D3C76_545820 [compost metagenome]